MSGLGIALICAFFQSTKDLVSKKLAFTVSGATSAFASFIFALPFYVVLLAVLFVFGKESFAFSATFMQYVILRSLSDTAAEWLKMSALRLGDISLLSCFFALAPIFLLLTSPLITGDPITLLGLSGVLVVVAGSIIAVWDPNAKNGSIDVPQRKGITLALLSALFMSLNSCFDRLAALEATPVLSGFAMTFLAAIFLLPFVLLQKKEKSSQMKGNYGAFFLRGGLETAFMVTKIWALQYMSAPAVVALQRVAIPVSILGGRLLFNEQNFRQRMIGGLVVMIGVALTVFDL